MTQTIQWTNSLLMVFFYMPPFPSWSDYTPMKQMEFADLALSSREQARGGQAWQTPPLSILPAH